LRWKQEAWELQAILSCTVRLCLKNRTKQNKKKTALRFHLTSVKMAVIKKEKKLLMRMWRT
jgi:hypothetical protein